jgi:tRNA-Thr(GGU) m(6)t(6)A37 methyltransferase TsaA
MNTTYQFNPIGIAHSCFTEKFGIPRQPGLVPAARAKLEILPPYDQDEAFRGLEKFSHLWIVFVFHGIPEDKWRPTVRPPRLGGNRRIGVFATRSGFRPNPIGMSAVRQEGCRRKKGTLFLDVSGIDLLDRTPILDIKPYLPYADNVTGAIGGFAAETPLSSLSIEFTDQARQACIRIEEKHPDFTDLLNQVLKADPRPAYAGTQGQKSEYGLRLYDININWTVRQKSIIVHAIADLGDE